MGTVWVNIIRDCHGWTKGEVVNLSIGVAEIMVGKGDAEYRDDHKSMAYRAIDNKGVANGDRGTETGEHGH